MQLMKHIPGGWERTIAVRNPNGTVEEVSVGFIIQINVDHIDHHIKQIEAIRAELAANG